MISSRSLRRHDVLINHDNVIGVVINKCQSRGSAVYHSNGDAERSALPGVDVELTNKLARLRQFDDFARLGRIGVDGVAVAGDEVSVRRQS